MIRGTAALQAGASRDNYVLRSLLASVVVERARQLATFTRPGDAVVGGKDAMAWSAATFEPEVVALFGSARTAEEVVKDLVAWAAPSPWPVAGYVGSATARTRLAGRLLTAPTQAETWAAEVEAFTTACSSPRSVAHARQVARTSAEIASIGRRSASLARSQVLAHERELRHWEHESDRRTTARSDHQRGPFAADWAAVDAGHGAMVDYAVWRRQRAEATHHGLRAVADQASSAAVEAEREAERTSHDYERLLETTGRRIEHRWPWQAREDRPSPEEVAAALRLHGAFLNLLPATVRQRLIDDVVSRLTGGTDRRVPERSSVQALFVAVPFLSTTPQSLMALPSLPESFSPGWLIVEETRKPVRSDEMLLRRHARRLVTLSSDGDVVAVEDRVA